MSLLEQVYRRVGMAKKLNDLRVLHPLDDESVRRFCNERGMDTFSSTRAKPGNLMEELLCAAKELYFDAVVEITGDCPFVDGRMIDEMVEAFKYLDVGYYVYLEVKGAEIRIVRPHLLQRAAKWILRCQRNGTTMFYEQNPRWIGERCEKGIETKLDLSIDEFGDLVFAQEILERLPWDAPLEKIVNLAESLTA